MTLQIPSQFFLTFGACMLAILTIQLLDKVGVPKWAQWLGAAVIIVLAWVTFGRA